MKALLIIFAFGLLGKSFTHNYKRVTRAVAAPAVVSQLDSMYEWSVQNYAETGRCTDGLRLLNDSTVEVTHLRVLRLSDQDSVSMFFAQECKHTVHVHFMPSPWLRDSASDCDRSTAAKLHHSVDFILTEDSSKHPVLVPYHATRYDPRICK